MVLDGQWQHAVPLESDLRARYGIARLTRLTAPRTSENEAGEAGNSGVAVVRYYFLRISILCVCHTLRATLFIKKKITHQYEYL